jgi:hypothetical protein
MNLAEMNLEFDEVMRTLTDTNFTDQKNRYINASWRHVSEMFEIPSLKKTATIASVANQQYYPFPYDYNGTDVYLWYRSTTGGTPRRLDPVTEEVLALMYERRTGNMGPEWYYDWSGPTGVDGSLRNCTPGNGMTVIPCSDCVAADVNQWLRIDPWVDTTVLCNPGDYGYYITGVTPGVAYTIDRTYRGPSANIAAQGRVTPAETQQFKMYGIPNSAVANAFELRYYAQPQRLYNDADVPEWPSIGIGIVYLAISIAHDYLRNADYAKLWYGRAMSRITGLQRRKERTATLVSDLTVGSVSGRQTGARSVDLGRRFSRR